MKTFVVLESAVIPSREDDLQSSGYSGRENRRKDWRRWLLLHAKISAVLEAAVLQAQECDQSNDGNSGVEGT